jgi:chitodextrinase
MRRAASIAVLALITASALVTITAGVAQAAPQVHNSTIPLTGTSSNHSLLNEGRFCDDCAPDALFDCGGCQVAAGATVDVHTSVKWSAPASIDSTFDPDELHQGQTAGVENALTPGAGPIEIRYTVDYAIGIFACDGNFDPCDGPPKNWQVTGNLTFVDSKTLSANTNCTPPLTGTGNVVCIATNSVNLFPETCFFVACAVDVTVDLDINNTFTVSPGDMIVHRTASFVSPADLTFAGPVPSIVNDSVAVPCTATPGTTVNYQLGPADYTPANVTVTGSAGLHIIIDGPGPLNADPTINLVSGEAFNGTLTMHGDAAPEFALGDVLLDNTAPNVTAILQGGTFLEGSELTFSALASDNCSTTLSYRWEYSDGGQSFFNPTHHTFADNGHYTGTVAVRDAAGNATIQDFAVNGTDGVGNDDPNVPTPPNATSVWGVPISFHADAVDPGSADQSTLSFHWTFGDGAGALGADTSHTYANPGSYPVVVTVTDKDGGVGTASLTADITKRLTSLAYTGDVQALPNKFTTLSAQVTDQLGLAVVGRPVMFTLGTQGGSGLTDGAGTARTSFRLKQHVGDYTVTATFAGDAWYFGSTDSADFTIGN